MATANAAATLQRASDWGTSFATGTMVIKAGATVLATHNLAGFVASNSGNDGLATANTISDVTIAATGTADSAEINDGSKTYTLTLGTSGTEVIVSTTNYISGETSSILSLVANFPA